MLSYISYLFVGFVFGAILGYWLCAHIHAVAAKAVDAVKNTIGEL